MNKKSLLNFWLLLLCMIVGSGTAWAEETPDVTYDVANGTVTGKTLTASGATFSGGPSNAASFKMNTGYFMLGKSGAYINFPTYEKAVKKIVVTGRSGASASTKMNIFVGDNAVSTETEGSTGTNTYEINSNYQEVGTQYTLKVTSNHNAQITKIEVFFVAGPSGPQDLTFFAFTNTTPSVKLSKNGNSYEASYTQTVTVDPDSYDGTITYAIDAENSTFDTNNAIIDDKTGELTISTTNNVGGTIIVKASGEATDAYNAPADATYTLTVNAAPVGVGTPTFSLATGSYYYGTTVEIEAVNSTLITYTTDDTTPTMESTTYSAPVAITKTMTLKAKAWDNELNESEVASIDYTLKTPEAPTFSVNGGEVLPGSTVTLTSGEGGSVIVYTTDGTDPTIESDIYDAPITINAAMTIKAATVDGGDNLSSIATASFTVKQVDVYEKVTDASTLAAGDKLLIVYEAGPSALGALGSNSYASTNSVTISNSTITDPDSKVAIITLGGEEDAWTLFSSLDAKYLSLTSNSNKLEIAANAESDNQKWSVTISNGNASISNNGISGRYILANPSSSRFACYTSTGSSIKAVQLYRLQEKLEEATVTISPSENFELNYGGTKVLTVTTTSDATITASSSDESVATVAKTGDEEYTVTAVSGSSEGVPATISFAVAKTATYKAAKSTIVATVKDSRVDLELSFDPTSVDVNIGQNVDAPTLNGNAGSGTVTYASNDETIATVNATTGEVTGVAEGTTTITATVAEVTGYKSGTASFTVNVIDPNKKGTENNPYTVAEARAAIDANTGVTGVYAKGIVSTAGSLSSGAISYYISDDGTTTNELQAYRGKSFNGNNFTSADDIQVGDVVVIYGNLKKYNAIYEFDANNKLVSLVRKPSITATPAPFAAPSYEVGTAAPTYETLTVNGKNLTADITLTLDENSKFEMSTDLENWASSLALTQSEGSVTNEEVAVRLKAGLEKGNYAGEITLTSTDADNVVVELSGTVTGQTYAINVDDQVVGGTIEADLENAEEGATVTLTATPVAGYTFGSWTVYKDDMSTEVTVTDNQFTMPDCEVYVTATFNAKPTYAVTCTASPVAGGMLEASPASAYEGQTVTLSYVAEDGYSLSSIVITKTSDGSATEITPVASGDDFTFTMPDYAVTATAIFESNTFEGSFAQVTSISALEDGGYYILYRQSNAMNSTLTSGKMGATKIYPTNGFFENPDKSIVWKLVKNGDKWDLYSEKEGKYCYIEGTNTSSFKMAATASYHYTITATEGGFFNFKTTHSSSRGIEYGNNDFGSYADSNNPKVYLYKYTTLTERTITFNGNGGATDTEATEYTQTVYDGVETTLDANTFAKAGHEFAGWNTVNDGTGISYADGATITVTGADLTLYAQWAPLYTLTIDNNIDGGTVYVEGDVTTAAEGTEITLSYLASTGHAFNSWNVYKADDETTKVTVTNNKFDMPAYNVVVSASFNEVPTYSLATSITPGKHYIIASGTDGSVKAMGNQNSNNRSAVSVTASNGSIPETEGMYEFVIYGPDASGNYTIYNADGGYLYAASSNSNYLKTQTTNDLNGKWRIEFNGSEVSIVAQGSNNRNVMQYNSTSSIFSCYGSASQSDVYLYEKDNDTPVATTASVKLNASGYATFATTSTLDFLDAENAGFSAWQITSVTGSAINFAQITSTVEAATGILLKGTPGATVNLNILPMGGAELSENKLEGITTPTAIEADTYYGLSGNKFVKVNAGTVPAGKALLPASEISASARELTFVFNDGTTGISSIEKVQLTNDKYYNLNGQRVENPKKGSLYIVNGKKVIMK